MSKTIAVIVGLVLLVALVLFSMTFTVNFHEVAIKTRFGKITPDSIITKPGLKFRLPLFADRVTVYDTRLQLRETPLETVQTSDGQQVVVRAFMLWKVNTAGDGPLTFYRSYPTVEEASEWLVDPLRTALQSGLSRFAFDDLIGEQSRLKQAEEAIRAEIVATSSVKGIEPVSVGISQLMLPPKTAAAVLLRMEATRVKIAEGEHYRGSAEATGIESVTSSQADKIRQFAEQRAAEIQSVGDEQAAKYIALMNEEKDLAVFLSWLDALQASLSMNATLVIPSSFAPFHIVQLNTPTNRDGIPLPTVQDGVIGVQAPLVEINPRESVSLPRVTAPTNSAQRPQVKTPAETPAVEGGS